MVIYNDLSRFKQRGHFDVAVIEKIVTESPA